MDLIEGGGQPNAHLHRTAMPNCDLCGADLKGRMPNPYWVATSDHKDADGYPAPGATVRMYLCKEHREAMKEAIERAWKREIHRDLAGQRMLPDLPHLHEVE